MQETTYPAPIANYYGTPELVGKPGAWRLAIDNWDEADSCAVSDAFALAWIKEFAPNPPEKDTPDART